MAIKNENGYFKITEATMDFINNRTIIGTLKYKTENDRLIEKNISEKVHAFLNSLHAYLNQEQIKLDNNFEQCEDKELYMDADTFFNDHAELKEQRDTLFAKYEEYEYLRTHLLSNLGVDTQKLHYIDTWRLLGLSEEICVPISIMGTMRLGFDGIEKAELPELYPVLKERLSEGNSTTKDC